MSRIHEALKKAEEERAKFLKQEPEAPAVAENGEAAAMPVMGLDEGMAAAVQSVPPRVLGRGLSFEELVTRCQAADWKPDAERLVFLNHINSHAPGQEEFRTLRSRLYQIRQKQRLQTVLVTSALPGEGKSFVASNLAGVIARQQGRRALLVDADLRRSHLHVVLGTPVSPGLTEYLRGEAAEDAVIQRGPIDNLFFLPGGSHVANPAELIANGRLKTLLQNVAEAFDWIILDSSPAVLVSDASVIADVCDGVLLVLKSAVTPLDMARKARQEFHNKPLLGVVLNQVETHATYGSYYHYGRPGKHGAEQGRSKP